MDNSISITQLVKERKKMDYNHKITIFSRFINLIKRKIKPISQFQSPN